MGRVLDCDVQTKPSRAREEVSGAAEGARSEDGMRCSHTLAGSHTARDKVASRAVSISGGRSLTRPLRDASFPPVSLDTVVARTECYTYDVGVWDVHLVQGPFSAAPCSTLT